MKTVIGRLDTPSGNACTIHMIKDGLGRDVGYVSWDKNPPTPEDLSFYDEIVLPIFSTKGYVFLEVTTT